MMALIRHADSAHKNLRLDLIAGEAYASSRGESGVARPVIRNRRPKVA